MADRTRSGTSNAGSTRPGVAVSPAVAVVLLAAVGAGLRLWQYLANSSLWIDEAALARNIIDRAPASLLQPLDYAQVAPPAFLLTEKGIVTLLGSAEWALRLFPLVCGLFAIVLFWRLAALTLTGWAVPYAVGLFSLGTPLVYFSSQVKQVLDRRGRDGRGAVGRAAAAASALRPPRNARGCHRGCRGRLVLARGDVRPRRYRRSTCRVGRDRTQVGGSSKRARDRRRLDARRRARRRAGAPERAARRPRVPRLVLERRPHAVSAGNLRRRALALAAAHVALRDVRH